MSNANNVWTQGITLASRNGKLDTVKATLSNAISEIFCHGTQGGHKHVVDYSLRMSNNLETEVKFDYERALSIAAQHCQNEMFHYLHSLNPTEQYNWIGIMSSTILGNNVDIFNFIKDSQPFKLQCNQRQQGCLFSWQNPLANAAFVGNWEMFEWLANSIPVPEEISWDEILRNSATKGHLDIAKYAYNKDADWKIGLSMGVYNHQMNIIEYFIIEKDSFEIIKVLRAVNSEFEKECKVSQSFFRKLYTPESSNERWHHWMWCIKEYERRLIELKKI